MGGDVGGHCRMKAQCHTLEGRGEETSFWSAACGRANELAHGPGPASPLGLPAKVEPPFRFVPISLPAASKASHGRHTLGRVPASLSWMQANGGQILMNEFLPPAVGLGRKEGGRNRYFHRPADCNSSLWPSACVSTQSQSLLLPRSSSMRLRHTQQVVWTQ